MIPRHMESSSIMTLSAVRIVRSGTTPVRVEVEVKEVLEVVVVVVMVKGGVERVERAEVK